MDKRGETHVEMILTFVFFIAIVGIVFYQFNPFKVETSPSDADYLLNNIISSLESEVYLYTLVIKPENFPPSQTSATIKVHENDLEIDLKDTGLGVSVMDNDGQQISYKIQGNHLYFDWDSAYDKIIVIKASNAITRDSNNLPGGGPQGEYYSISTWQNNSIASKSQALELIGRYNDNYDLLKSELGIPQGNDFSFNIEHDPPLLQLTSKEILDNLRVDSRNKLVEFIDSDGNIKFIEVSAKIW